MFVSMSHPVSLLFCHYIFSSFLLCSINYTKRICGFLWLLTDLSSGRNSERCSWCSCVWVNFGSFVTDPASLTTPLPSSCSWPLPPPVAQLATSFRRPPSLSYSLPPSLILLPRLSLSPPTPSVFSLPASGANPSRGGWVTLESSTSLSSF